MKIQYRDITTDRYPLRSKIYLPDCPVQGVILGIHGFAGGMESSVLEALACEAGKKGIALLCSNFPAHGNSSAQEDMLTCKLRWPTAAGAELNGRGAAATAT